MQYDITSSTTGTNTASDYSVAAKQTDGSMGVGQELYWDNPYFTKWYGYYLTIPELKSAVDALATWVLGQGYECNSKDFITLRHINGWGEDTFLSILWNLLVTKKINGDAYAEKIYNGKVLVNLKPLDPSSMRIVCNPSGRIIRYEQRSKNKKETKSFKPEEIFHISNNRVADNIHGQSIIEPVEWVVLARNEAMADKRKMLHLSTIRIMEVDEDDPTRLAYLKSTYAEAIKSGVVMFVPKGTGTIQDLTAPSSEHLEWIRYLENFFYQALGVPKVILGGTAENTEASSKVSVIVFEPFFTREITELESDIWNQLQIDIKINKQPSLMDNMYSDEQKNTGQVGFQPNDVQAGKGK